MKFEKAFGRKPVFGMMHTGHSGYHTMLELAKWEIETYLRFHGTERGRVGRMGRDAIQTITIYLKAGYLF